eukprot:CAMPEP_0173375590 /NCGR_PEP_ID=MMETSP1144-20121109/29711_1 /TAXON_ID=483371 /ORGANISM="non described non described, Strain CCMP2298" /LENGTH=161 /DNA_ID=CAMNT_0014328039 /DNA_START=72 /DNA_END=558 /DNA_ORIENTATION=-
MTATAPTTATHVTYAHLRFRPVSSAPRFSERYGTMHSECEIRSTEAHVPADADWENCDANEHMNVQRVHGNREPGTGSLTICPYNPMPPMPMPLGLRLLNACTIWCTTRSRDWLTKGAPTGWKGFCVAPTIAEFSARMSCFTPAESASPSHTTMVLLCVFE